MLPLLVVVMTRFAAIRARRAAAAGRHELQRVWRAAVILGVVASLASPFYGARVSSDAMSATLEAMGSPVVPGGGVDQMMDRLDAAGLDAIVAVTNAYADGAHEKMVAHARGPLVDEQGTMNRWLDRGRFVDNLTAIFEGQEQRVLPLLILRRHAEGACGDTDVPKWGVGASTLLTEESSTTKVLPAAMVDAARTEAETHCKDVLGVIDRDLIRSDTDAYERGSSNDILVDALLLSYEPGQRERVEG